MVMAIIDRFLSDIEYLAIPYSHKDEKVMDYRASVSDFICSKLMKNGRLIYAPISSCHHIAKKYGLPRNWEFWKHLDEEYIKICKRVVVITLPGWEISTGVTAEIELANIYGIPVEKLDPSEYLKEMEMIENERRNLG